MGDENMLKIGDFSKLTHVSVRMLRYYDAQGLLKPSHVDAKTGYRMYSVDQVQQLQKIILLRDLSFTIAEIKEMLENWDDKYLVESIYSKIEETQKIIALEQKRISNLTKVVQHIESNHLDTHYNVIVKSVPSQKVLSLRKKVENHFCEGILWEELDQFVQTNHVEIERHSHNNIAIYHDNEYKDNDVDTEVCFIVKSIGCNSDDNRFCYRELEPVDTMASMMVYGSYENLAGAYQSFVGWLTEHQQQFAIGEKSRLISIIGQHNTDNLDDYLTEIQIPLIRINLF